MTRQPWECHNCRRIYAPHMDHCDCRPLVTAPPHNPQQGFPLPSLQDGYYWWKNPITCGKLDSVSGRVWTQ